MTLQEKLDAGMRVKFWTDHATQTRRAMTEDGACYATALDNMRTGWIETKGWTEAK